MNKQDQNSPMGCTKLFLVITLALIAAPILLMVLAGFIQGMQKAL